MTYANKVTDFTVNRDKWLRGGKDPEGRELEDETTLLNEDGNMCCLGFYGLACGLKESDILNVSLPTEITIQAAYNAVDREMALEARGTASNEYPELEYPEFLALSAGSATEILSNTNDDVVISDLEREKLLKERFAYFGVNVEFVGQKR